MDNSCPNYRPDSNIQDIAGAQVQAMNVKVIGVVVTTKDTVIILLGPKDQNTGECPSAWCNQHKTVHGPCISLNLDDAELLELATGLRNITIERQRRQCQGN